MSLQLILTLTFIVGAIICSWMCIATSRSVKNERLNIIKKEIKSIGGDIINIEQIKRTNCPINNEYIEIGLSYKFYKVKYEINNKLKEGWAILSMKQNWYGPNGAIDSKWMWRL